MVPPEIAYGRNAYGGLLLISVPVAAAMILPSDPYRLALVIMAPTGGNVAFGPDASVTLATGWTLIPGNQSSYFDVKRHYPFIAKQLFAIASVPGVVLPVVVSSNSDCEVSAISGQVITKDMYGPQSSLDYARP